MVWRRRYGSGDNPWALTLIARPAYNEVRIFKPNTVVVFTRIHYFTLRSSLQALVPPYASHGTRLTPRAWCLTTLRRA